MGRIFDFFEKDHREIDSLFLDLRFKALAEYRGIFEEYDRRLERHIVWEETILFPALAEKNPMFKEGPIRVMLIEHKEIRQEKAAIIQALKKADLAGAKTHEKALASVLSHHNAKEEQVLYPACDRFLEDKDIESVFLKTGT